MNSENVSIKEIVEYGLETISDDRLISVNLKDLIYIHQVLSEYNRFFHQPMHYPKFENISNFLGDKNSGGGYEVLTTALYQKIRKMIPPDIEEMMDDSIFQNPIYPAYYKT